MSLPLHAEIAELQGQGYPRRHDFCYNWLSVEVGKFSSSSQREAVMVDTPESVEAAREAVAEGVKAARDRFQRVSGDVQERYQKVSEDVRRGAERATQEIRRGAERAKEQYREVADTAREGYDKARRQAGDWSRDVSYYVKDNPGKSLLMAAGVGFLLGLLARRGGSED
jgi:ElaB/YqjD/DUF883 family membrane-anchored ribosome-binding protein